MKTFVSEQKSLFLGVILSILLHFGLTKASFPKRFTAAPQPSNTLQIQILPKPLVPPPTPFKKAKKVRSRKKSNPPPVTSSPPKTRQTPVPPVKKATTVVSQTPAILKKKAPQPKMEKPLPKRPVKEVPVAQKQVTEPPKEIAQALPIIQKENFTEIKKAPEPSPQKLAPPEKEVSFRRLNQEENVIQLSHFLQQLAVYSRYPRLARRKGWQGKALVRVLLDSKGELVKMKLLKSTGYALLDRKALQAVKQACPFQHGLGDKIQLDVPLVYRLRPS